MKARRHNMEVGQEPELREVDWDLIKGHEYLILETIIEKVKYLK